MAFSSCRNSHSLFISNANRGSSFSIFAPFRWKFLKLAVRAETAVVDWDAAKVFLPRLERSTSCSETLIGLSPKAARSASNGTTRRTKDEKGIQEGTNLSQTDYSIYDFVSSLGKYVSPSSDCEFPRNLSVRSLGKHGFSISAR